MSEILNNYIDFDYSSKCWLENKIKLGEGMYRYRCTAYTKKGSKCEKKPKLDSKYCHIHSKKNGKE